MGCVSSKIPHRWLPDRKSNIFRVWNVDDVGNKLTFGHMEVTETELILKQKGREVVSWPMRSLRRYGFDEHRFSFESGRRCPTGAGIYAFQCRKAEQLFNLVQEHINNCGQREQDMAQRQNQQLEINLSQPISNGLQAQTSRQTSTLASPGDGYLEPISAPSSVRGGAVRNRSEVPNRNSQSNYINETVLIENNTANYQNSSVAPSPSRENNSSFQDYIAACSPPNYSNNCVVELTNKNTAVRNWLSSQQNIEVEEGGFPVSKKVVEGYTIEEALAEAPEDEEMEDRVYMNVVPQDRLYNNPPLPPAALPARGPSRAPPPTPSTPVTRPTIHNLPNIEEVANDAFYANVDLPLDNNNLDENSNSAENRMNYVLLDLDQVAVVEQAAAAGPPVNAPKPESQTSRPTVPVNPSPVSVVPMLFPESPTKRTEGYATIDFDKTAALSNSHNPSLDEDESLRKTRHSCGSRPPPIAVVSRSNSVVSD